MRTIMRPLLTLLSLAGSCHGLTFLLTDFNRCSWTVSLANSRTPHKATLVYFNEKESYDVHENLRSPDITRFLQPVQKGDSIGYFIFPYFILVRANCDGGAYDTSFYQVLIHAIFPTISIEYQTPNARASIRNSLKVSSFGAVINLEHNPDDPAVPTNPAAPICYGGMCYPAFVVPLVFLHAPIISVTVEAVGRFQQKHTKIYSSPYHSRKTERLEDLEIISPGDKEPEAKDFFPENRIGTTEDPVGLGPEVIEDLTDVEHYPLDKDDFIEAKWTSGSSPALIFSGFYHPDLVIVTNPDGENMRLARWTRNPMAGNKSDENSTIFDHALTCNLPQTYGNDPNYPIPRFTTTERRAKHKNDWLHTYYRKRYHPLKYYQTPVPHAIYDLISLEDRLLMITNSGLVPFYGITNVTVDTDMTLKAPDDEKLRRCFKLVRSSRFTQEVTEMLIAVSYRYEEMKIGGKAQKAPTAKAELVTQEIYLGKLVTPGKRIDWQKIGQTAGMDEEEYSNKKPGSDSKVFGICYRAMDIYFADFSQSITLDACWLLDATPAVGMEDTIQVLIEMTIIHYPTLEMMKEHNKELGIVPADAEVVFYILAQHTPRQYYTKETWDIISVLPQRPCVAAHAMSMTNIENLDTEYFSKNEEEEDVTLSEQEKVEDFRANCHYKFRHKLHEELHIRRMTYTKQKIAQVYLYGNRLLHSTNGGGAFAYSPDFPSREESRELERLNREYIKSDDADREKKHSHLIRMVRKHVIRLMAFSVGAHFAFLTSSRHLYVGSSGSLHLIRLRPSPGYSMIRMLVSDKPGIHDARPFSLVFQSENLLYEFVAVVNSEKQITMIRRRLIPWDLIIRNSNFVNKLKDRVHKLKKKSQGGGDKGSTAVESLANVFTPESKRHLTTYCPYGDQRVYQNYSTSLRRMQQFIIRPPLQHPALGEPLSYTALMAYQASAYSLIFITYLNPVVQPYSKEQADPFQGWVNLTKEEAVLGFFRFISGDPYDYGIIVNPSTFKRITDTDKSSYSPIERYYLDYNQIILIQLSFSSTTKGALLKTDYHLQKLSNLHVTVDNGNGSVVNIETEKTLDYIAGVAKFKIFVSVSKETAKLKQSPPGEHSLIVPLTFHFINGFGQCVADAGSSMVGDSMTAKVYAGCPPGSELRLNGNMSLRTLKFRNPHHWYGLSEDDCVHGQQVCFYTKLPVILHFVSFDRSKQKNEPYLGHYTLRVVGGGYTPDSIVDYTAEEQGAYNIPGMSDVSLVWSEWDLMSNEKVKLKAREGEDDLQAPGQDVVLKAGQSAIKWTCHTMSPCARVLPSVDFQSVYYFKIRISNRGVGGTFTSCLYERDFVIQLYGFTPSPEMQLIISLLFSAVILLILYFMYLCCRNQRRVWRANRVKMYGWLQIVIDTIPKSRSVSDTSKELRDQVKHDEILLSLQGHLRVPKFVAPTKRRERKEESQAPSLGSLPSRESSGSRDSSVSRASSQDDQTLPHVHTRVSPATWTDMIYDQIIAKRLNAIVDRNNEIKESILRKVELSEKNKEDLMRDRALESDS